MSKTDIRATTTAKDWGFHPIAGKGGKTTNHSNKNKKKEN